MKNWINRILSRMGFAIISKKKLRYHSIDELKKMHQFDDLDMSYVKGKLGMGLKEKLISEGKTRWLDIGCGGNFENDFFYLDNFPEDTIKDRQKYFRVDIVNMNDDEADRIGKFDLVRLQHVFEHFTPEEGIRVLGNCAKLLNPDGYILISTPDLKKYVHMYLSGKIKENFPWALTRIEKNSPDSFYFSVFAHSVLHEQHKWCYDIEGLIYQMNATGKFKNITELRITDELAASPFTHNRPHEDVCVLAQLK